MNEKEARSIAESIVLEDNKSLIDSIIEILIRQDNTDSTDDVIDIVFKNISSYGLIPNINPSADWRIYDNLDFALPLQIKGQNYIIYNNCDFSNLQLDGDGNSAAVTVRDSHHIIFYNCIFSENGNWKSITNRDIHGLAIVDGSHHVYVVNSTLYHNEGDSIQVNAYFTKDADSVHDIFIVGNYISEDRENAIDIKASRDVVIAYNKISGYRISPDGYSGDGSAIVAGQEGAKRTWIFNNTIADSSRGIRGSNNKNTTEYYIWDNVFELIHHDTRDNKDLSSQWSSGAAMQFWYYAEIFAANNTYSKCDKDIVLVKYNEKPKLVVNEDIILSEYKNTFLGG